MITKKVEHVDWIFLGLTAAVKLVRSLRCETRQSMRRWSTFQKLAKLDM